MEWMRLKAGREILKHRQMVDYHVHTALCNHADGSMREYLECACEKGLAEFCFLDHLILHPRSKMKLTSTPKNIKLSDNQIPSGGKP